MREDKWAREDHARVSLLKNVYESRLQTAELRKVQKGEYQWMREYERNQMQSEIARQQ